MRRRRKTVVALTRREAIALWAKWREAVMRNEQGEPDLPHFKKKGREKAASSQCRDPAFSKGRY
jgi:hypothetical protein